MAEKNAGEDPPPAKKAKTSNDQRKSRNVITLQTKIDIIQQHKAGAKFIDLAVKYGEFWQSTCFVI